MGALTKDSHVGVLGAGTMGAGIAQIAAAYGHMVLLFDSNDQALTRAKAKLAKIYARLVEKGKVLPGEAAEIQNRIRYTGELQDLAPCGLVIEAIVENLDIKQQVLAELCRMVDEGAVLATNTSSLSIASIGAACTAPERFLGAHFFNPAPLMPLVEIVPGIATAASITGNTRALIDDWGKTTVLAKDTPGFIVNRVARPFYGEAIRQLEEGIADAATIDWAMREIGGFRMGPFQLMDFIGNDINLTVTETVFKAFFHDPRYRPSFTQQRLVEAGRLGKKSGRGYYDYADNAAQPQPKKDEVLGNEIFMRILVMLINEAVDAVFWNVATAEDVDLAMTKGVNYPKGLLAWGDELGLDRVLEALQALQDEYAEDRYRPSPLLKRMVRRKARSFK